MMFCVVYDRQIKRGRERRGAFEDAACRLIRPCSLIPFSPRVCACRGCLSLRRLYLCPKSASASHLLLSLVSPPPLTCLRSFFQMYTLMLGVAAVWVFFLFIRCLCSPSKWRANKYSKKKRKVGDVLFIWCQAQNMDIRLKLHWSAKRHRRRAVYVV